MYFYIWLSTYGMIGMKDVIKNMPLINNFF